MVHQVLWCALPDGTPRHWAPPQLSQIQVVACHMSIHIAPDQGATKLTRRRLFLSVLHPRRLAHLLQLRLSPPHVVNYCRRPFVCQFSERPISKAHRTAHRGPAANQRERKSHRRTCLRRCITGTHTAPAAAIHCFTKHHVRIRSIDLHQKLRHHIHPFSTICLARTEPQACPLTQSDTYRPYLPCLHPAFFRRPDGFVCKL